MIKKKSVVPFEVENEDMDRPYSKLGQIFIVVTCLSIFPLIYVIGKWIMSIL